MKVYRVEYPDGVGPYQVPDPYDFWRYEMHMRLIYAHHNKTHPVAWPDLREGDLCGFRSMRDLFRWFGGFLPVLLANKAMVATYIIEPKNIVYEDDYQIGFRR